MVKEFGDPGLEHVDKELAKRFEPGEAVYAQLLQKLERLADNLIRINKLISDFAARVNSGKILDKSLETDIGIHLNTEKAEKSI